MVLAYPTFEKYHPEKMWGFLCHMSSRARVCPGLKVRRARQVVVRHGDEWVPSVVGWHLRVDFRWDREAYEGWRHIYTTACELSWGGQLWRGPAARESWSGVRCLGGTLLLPLRAAQRAAGSLCPSWEAKWKLRPWSWTSPSACSGNLHSKAL